MSEKISSEPFGLGESGEGSFSDEKAVYTLLEPTLSPPEITLIEETHDLMREYSYARLAQPLQAEEITAKYVDIYANMLTNALPTIDDPAALVDALAVVRCLRAVCFGGDVMEWVQAADPGWDEGGVLELMKVEDPRENPILWRYINETAVVGRLAVVETALREAVAGGWDAMEPAVQECVSDTLYLCKAFEPGSRDSKKMAINLRVKCEELADRDWRTPLVALARILQGDKQAIVKAAPAWYSAVGGLYMYVEPSLSDLAAYYKLATARHPVDRTLDWEEACAALMEQHLLYALASLKQLDVTVAMACAEFCHQQGLLQAYAGAGRNSIREYVALRHVLLCLSNPDLVMTGLEMLDNMSGSRAARNLAAQVLPQLAARDPGLTELAIELATELRLAPTVSQLLAVSARRAVSDGDIVAAVEAYVTGGDLAAARHACWALFEASLVRGTMDVGDRAALEDLQSATVPAALPAAVAACLAPCAVLAGLLAAIGGDAGDVRPPVRALLSFAAMPASYYPLLVALVTQTDLRRCADRPTMALLIASLDRWDAAPDAERQRGLDLLDSGRGAAWAEDVDGSHSAQDLVWMLRRRLASDVVVL